MLRLACRTRHAIPCTRSYVASASQKKVPLALVAELRKQTQASISKAREALTHSSGSIPGALEWLQQDLASSGEAKAAKVASRATREGLIGVSVLSHGAGLNAAGGVRAAMVELNCETDFVGRNELFTKLAMDVAHTAAFIFEPASSSQPKEIPSFGNLFCPLPLEMLLDAPLLSYTEPGSPPNGTVATAIRDAIVKVGENISLRRARAIAEDSESPSPSNASVWRLGSYVHGALHGLTCGRVGALALINLRSSHLTAILRQEKFRQDLAALERSFARQIVGFDTLSITSRPENEMEEQALYKQPFITLAGEFNGLPVSEALRKWSILQGLANESEITDQKSGVEVIDFLKWTVGEAEA